MMFICHCYLIPMSENYGPKNNTKFKTIGIERPISQNPNTDPGFLVNSDPPPVIGEQEKMSIFPSQKGTFIDFLQSYNLIY
jgi:hypothetical protein